METQNKLLINHLAKRLPYGLKYKLPISSERMYEYIEDYYWSVVHTLETAIEAEIKEAIELNNLVLSQKNPFIAIEDNEIFLGQMESNLGFDVDDVFLNEVKPLLFTLSSLTETITIKGQEVTPILELAKIAFPNESFKKMGFDALSVNIAFGYEPSIKSFIAGNMHNGKTLDIPNQELIWNKLYEFHIDTDSLIDKGLAISVFDLTENPYT